LYSLRMVVVGVVVVVEALEAAVAQRIVYF
jgi:hypothetical protein